MVSNKTRSLVGRLTTACRTASGWLGGDPAPPATAKRSPDLAGPQTVRSTVGRANLPQDPAVLVEVMLCEGRHALLLRPQIVGNLTVDQRRRAVQAIAREMALVEAGPVIVLDVAASLGDESDGASAWPSVAEAVQVERYFLDRHAVSNREFQQFVAAGGYEESSIWDPEVWPVVGDFVDRTGAQAPRFWQHGQPPRGLAQHPVVGISWYEATAYSRWLGKRLPSDAEWVRAASAPIALPGGELRQRKFPWGDLLDRARANLWGANPAGTAAVDAFPQGDTASGVRQMVGNVWEWTAGDLDLENWERLWPDGSLRSTAMKSLRGGAFDTYFDVQATCQFQSGDHPLARKHNLGFRCAVGQCDLQLADAPPTAHGDRANLEPAESGT